MEPDRRHTHLRPVGDDALIEYPLKKADRINTHFWIEWEFNRFLNSEFTMKCEPDVGFYAVKLFCIAQNQSPVGTLPDDDLLLATHLHLDLKAWQSLRQRAISPLHNWSLCDCEGEVRLYHPVVMEKAVKAARLRRKNAHKHEADRERKRLNALPAQIRAAGGTDQQANDAFYLDQVDKWLVEHVPGNRTAPRVREAMEALAMKMG